jgi:uncharacterized protein YkwD
VHYLKIKTLILFITIALCIQGLSVLFYSLPPKATAVEQVITTPYLANSISETSFVPSWLGLNKILNFSNDGVSVYNPKNIVLKEKELLIESGIIILSKPGTYSINSTSIELKSGIIVFDISQKIIRQFDGESTMDQITLFSGEQILNGDKGSYDRTLYNTPESQLFVDVLKQEKLLPESIEDFIPPKILLTSPQDAFSTGEESILVNGNAITARQILINTEAVATPEDGTFAKEIKLSEGENKISVQASDKWGNTSIVERTITYDPCLKIDCTPVKAPVYYSPILPNTGTPSSTPSIPQQQTTARSDSSVGCENSGFNYQFLEILNNYRVANGLNTLSIEGDLNLAACDHAKWMNETGEFSHTGIYGSSPVDRCRNRGTYCDAENLALSYPDNTPQRMFDLYKGSPGHNANMLGSHTVVGIAWAGIYNACSFR